MMKPLLSRILLGLILAGLPVCASAVIYDIPVSDPQTWSNEAVSSRRTGDTIRFSVPLIVNRNYGYNFSGLNMSPRRIFSPTNQAIPLSDEYKMQLSLNGKASFNLSGCPYHRNGERLHNLVAVVTGNLKVWFISGSWEGNNTRSELEYNPPSVDMDTTHNVLVCGANLEYYLVQSLGTGYGPDDDYDHQKQRTKVKTALARIAADVYGLVEIEQGQSALEEIASDLTALTGHPYDYINDQGSVNGSYTKSGYVYRSDRIQPVGMLKRNNTVVQNRKMVQGFELIENGERFVYSINHFKAKSGNGTGRNADQGDGQGIFNYSRLQEAQSVLQNIQSYQSFYGDNDILIMGDLNAYAKEDPIRAFTDAGMIDLHRYFHADSSYSYVYGEQAGYLDHAICNEALRKQVTGMSAWHVNSDEADQYTYDKSNDLTVFRYSDHDPVLVGLRLDSTLSIPMHSDDPISHTGIVMIDGEMFISNVSDWGEQQGYYEVYAIDGTKVQGLTRIEASPCPVGNSLHPGWYVIRLYYAGKTRSIKLMKLP